MNKKSIFFASAVILLSASIALGASKLGSTKNSLNRNYSEICRSIDHKSTAALEKYLAGNFQYIDKTGEKLNKKEFIKQLSSSFGRVSKLSTSRKITRIWLDHNQPIVLVDSNASMSIGGPSGKKMTAKLVTVTKDSWVSGHGNWQIKRSVMLSRKVYMNGKLMKMPSGSEKPHAMPPSQPK